MTTSEKPESPKESIKEPIKEVQKPEAVATPLKTESKKQEKKAEATKPIYPKYAGYSCPVCGSKRLTDDSGKYICPVNPKPSECPVE